MNDSAKRILESIKNLNPVPDIERLKKAVGRKELPDRVPLIELFPDDEIISDILGRDVPVLSKRTLDENLKTAYDAHIEFYSMLGYDYVRGKIDNFNLGHAVVSTEDTAKNLSRNKREWVNQQHGLITSMEDFESYPWPGINSLTTTHLEYLSEKVPSNMGIICQAGGIFEYTCWLMGFEVFAVSLYTQPELVEKIINRVGQYCIKAVEKASQVPRVTALFIGDDMGFKTQTMIDPEILIKKFLPCHKKMCRIAHDAGKFYFLHSCGKLDGVMDYIIDEAGADAKHSFEDTITPVTEAKKKWGGRISLFGGIDVDFLCRSSEDRIREYVRNVVDVCKTGGGYGLGTGNTVANYIPTENYLAMIDEGLKCGRYK